MKPLTHTDDISNGFPGLTDPLQTLLIIVFLLVLVATILLGVRMASKNKR